MKSIFVILFVPVTLLGQSTDSSRSQTPTNDPVVKYKHQYFMFPAIFGALGAALLFKDASELSEQSRELTQRAMGLSNPYVSPGLSQQALEASSEADRKTVLAVGLTITSVVLVWLAFEPTYEFPKSPISIIPTGNGLKLSYNF